MSNAELKANSKCAVKVRLCSSHAFPATSVLHLKLLGKRCA